MDVVAVFVLQIKRSIVSTWIVGLKIRIKIHSNGLNYLQVNAFYFYFKKQVENKWVKD